MPYSRYVLVTILGLLGLSGPLAWGGQESEEEEAKKEAWDTTLARGETREIEFSTEEGTFMSLDVSPDGQWIVFDLLAHVYRVPISGGTAECLTQDSGVAVNYHPAYSPDGEQIAFVSDRKGQSNLWIMDADGSNPRQVHHDLNSRVVEPAWTADGSYIIVRKQPLSRPGSRMSPGLFMYHREGGEGVELIGRDQSGAAWPAPSKDGKYVYFQVRAGSAGASGHRDALGGAQQIRRFEIETGDIADISFGTHAQQVRSSSGGAAAPEVSPDGRHLSFIRRVPDGTISYKGHRFGPRTALWLRDLKTGSERMIMDPVEQDMIEGMKTLRVLPGYSWTPDGGSIVISQGGKIRKLDISDRSVETIPFQAQVKRTISGQAYKAFRITDDPFPARFLRWHTASPDKSRVAFQAVGKIYVLENAQETPRRLTPQSFEPHEYGPAFSPDGNWIAFTTWDEQQRGHLWKISIRGEDPTRLSAEAGEYVNPKWSFDGSEIVVARGANATARKRNMTNNPWFEIVRIPASGGVATVVGRVDRGSGFGGQRSQLPRPSYGPQNRIFFLEGVEGDDDDGPPGNRPSSQLVSVEADGTEKRVHLQFQHADEATVSPDGKWVAFLEGDNVYLTALPYSGSGGKPVDVNKKRGKLPVRQLSKTGGLYPGWIDAQTVEFGNAATHYRYDIESKETTETELELNVPRDIPDGRIILSGARIVTLDGDEVIESGDIVVDGSRITCVGECEASDANQVIDVSGKTIVPGFVDMHAHHYREYSGMIPPHAYETAIYLAYGVTANLDNSMWSQNVFTTAELIDAGKVIGPRTFSTGDPLYNRDGARQNLLTSYQVAEQNIQRLKSWGATSVKQYLQPRRDQRQWVSDIARQEGLMVTSEGSDLAYNLGMIMDGQTAFEHPMSYMPLYQDAARFFGMAKAVYSPTVVVGGPAAWNEEYFWTDSEIWKDEKQRRWLPWRQLVPATRRRILRPETDYSFPLVAQGLADVIEQGGYGAIGSHGQQHGIASHWEIWMLAPALGNHGALDVASRHGAYFLGALEDVGTIEPGKLADLVVLNSNPLDNIRNTLDMQYVMKGGILYEADTLDEIWPRQRPFGEYYWLDEEIYRNDNRPVNWHDQQ